ncbi:3-hydroxyacyl-ACP dehydratase [bacterium]|nr:3-hydroxyacyl-ACP dehydratase [bacterium]
MIDSLTDSNGILYTTEFRIQSSNIFVDNGHLTEAGLIENIAQTAAAGLGYGFYQQNKSIPTGFIGAIQKLKIVELPDVNKKITTSVKVTNTVLNLTVISGTIQYDGKQIASCDMKLFLLES